MITNDAAKASESKEIQRLKVPIAVCFHYSIAVYFHHSIIDHFLYFVLFLMLAACCRTLSLS
jgi:hypothetical protein